MYVYLSSKPFLISYASYVDWSDTRNRRKFFETYAREHGFDPRDPEAWYRHTKKQILAVQVTSVINVSFFSILLCFFLLYASSIILTYQQGCKQSTSASQRSFQRTARSLPRYWTFEVTSLSSSEYVFFTPINIHSNISILQYFNISIFQYVINFTLALWGEAKIRRQFFFSYAKQNGFDYLVPSNWYDQPREKIMAAKVCIDQSVWSLLLFLSHFSTPSSSLAPLPST